MFIVAPDIDNESLLAHACESLALAIQQVIMLAELAVNRALDNVDVPQAMYRLDRVIVLRGRVGSLHRSRRR